jgi:superoxide dismutase, Cu-Zn family
MNESTNAYKYICIVMIVIVILIAVMNETIRNELFNMWDGTTRPIEAIASFRGPDSGNINGTVLFKENGNKGTYIEVDLTGVPNGKHGFHIHEAGNLSEGCKSACDHFNPTGVDHGDIDSGHVGDMGNIESINGRVKTTLYSKQIKLRGTHNVIGRSVIIHADKDDLGFGHGDSLKTGNAGARIACAVIGHVGYKGL